MSASESERDASGQPPVVGNEIAAEHVTEISAETDVIADQSLDAAADIRNEFIGRGVQRVQEWIVGIEVHARMPEADPGNTVRHPVATREVIQHVGCQIPN